MKICVVGCGRWGSLITWYLDSIGHKVTLFGRASSEHMKRLIKERKNNLLYLPESISLTTDINELKNADVIIISIASQALDSFMKQIASLDLENKTFVLCMKGIEIGTGKRLSEIVKGNTSPTNAVAVWLGPGHVQEFYSGIPNCMVIDSENEDIKHLLVNEFSSEFIRFYYGGDIIGNEIGAAAKNVIGIAAGLLDGMELSTLKGALMSRGTREIARLIKALGGNELSAYGLCHLGDYEATVFSKFSHNRQFGESVVKNEKYELLAEGYYTVKALVELGEKYDVDLPICKAVYAILWENANAADKINELFKRSLKQEF